MKAPGGGGPVLRSAEQTPSQRDSAPNLLEDVSEKRTQEGNCAATPVSMHTVALECETLKGDFGVYCAGEEPLGQRSDRIAVRKGIEFAEGYNICGLGLRKQDLDIDLFEHLLGSTRL